MYHRSLIISLFLYEKLRSICKSLVFHGHPHLLRIEITLFALFQAESACGTSQLYANSRNQPICSMATVNSVLPKVSPNVWAFIARSTGTHCPAFVLWMPTWWAVDAHAMGMVGPASGHRGHIFCFLLAFLCAFPLIYDTSMILLSLFLEKSHSVKPSECQIYSIRFYINNETLILFSRKYIYTCARSEPLL